MSALQPLAAVQVINWRTTASDPKRSLANLAVEAPILRISHLATLAMLVFLPIWAGATWYSIGTLEEWNPRIQSALKYIEVEYDEGVDSMPEEDRIGAIYLIAYLEGIRDGSLFNSALAYASKYGGGAAFDPENEIEAGFCLEDPYFEVVPKLHKHIAQADFADDTEFIDVLMSFLETEYACDLGNQELVIVARLNAISSPPPCGILHTGAVAEYVEIEVIEGRYSAEKIFVIHGCPEMPRKVYRSDAGDIEEFRVGDYHKLTLVSASRFDGGVYPLVDNQEAKLYFAVSALAATKRTSDE